MEMLIINMLLSWIEICELQIDLIEMLVIQMNDQNDICISGEIITDSLQHEL
jgi:hypothetical protein